MTDKLTLRRKEAIKQLEHQLELGTKPNKGRNAPEGMTATEHKKQFPRLPLTEKDKRRIRNNIVILKMKLCFPL